MFWSCLQGGNNVRGCAVCGALICALLFSSSRWGQWERVLWIAQQSAVLETRPSAAQTVSAHALIHLWESLTQKSQVNFIDIAQYHRSQFASRAFRISTAPASMLRPLIQMRKDSPENPYLTGKKESSGKATEEGSCSLDGQRCNKCRVYRIE